MALPYPALPARAGWALQNVAVGTPPQIASLIVLQLRACSFLDRVSPIV